MEHSDLDKLFRNSVESVESKSEISEDKMQSLWSRVEKQPVSRSLWYWKVASFILFALSGALVFALISKNNVSTVTSEEVKTERPVKLKLGQQKIAKDTQAILVESLPSEVKTKVVTETVVKYIDREKIVYVEKEVFIDRQTEIDSLNFVLQETKKENELLSSRLTKENEVENSNNNLQVAFLNEKDVQASTKIAEPKLKFQLSLFNSYNNE